MIRLIRWIMGFFKGKDLSLSPLSDEEIKNRVEILFVDDNEFRVVEILRNNGWRNVTRLIDVDSMDCPNVRRAHVIFVDINGVGRKLEFAQEGLGLVAELKRRYPEKRIVVYSAESQGDRFDDGLDVADKRIRKNSDPMRFMSLVEEYSRELFSPPEFISRLKSVLQSEYGVVLDDKELVRRIVKARDSGKTDVDGVSEIFNLDNAAKVASIISLFMSGQ